MPAQAQTPQRLVGKRLDQLQQARVAPKEVLAHVCARGNDKLLVFAVHHFAHALDEQAFGIAL